MSLTLTRRPQERICIGDQITVTVVRIRQGRVKLAIEAPEELDIWREGAPNDPPAAERNGKDINLHGGASDNAFLGE